MYYGDNLRTLVDTYRDDNEARLADEIEEAAIKDYHQDHHDGEWERDCPICQTEMKDQYEDAVEKLTQMKLTAEAARRQMKKDRSQS